MAGKKAKKKPPARNCNVYVIEMDPAVAQEKRFKAQNPQYCEGDKCLYVGMTACTPEERFEQHKNGYKASPGPRKYGLYLRHRLFKRFNPMTREEAAKREVSLAEDLRKKGFGVWQN